ncbi:MAG TPA: hypothetical protein PK821_07015, partial [Victivallales bacterium]|nr:hypothetical protein [Victivallales bacterium]
LPHKLHRSGKYRLMAGGGKWGGSSELVWNASGSTEEKFEITPFPSVRRRYGDKDPGEVTKIKVKGANGVVYKLKIEKVSGEGDASFDAAGTQKEIDYTGTGVQTDLLLYGLKESTEEHNIKITGSKDGKMLDEQKFIVFSEIKVDWTSDETQHKDTDASCVLCAHQAGVPPAHRHHSEPPEWKEKMPCDHVSFHSACKHCRRYCARCCMKVIKERGCRQDDFRNYADNGTRRTTVEENHGQFFESNWATKYGFGQLHKRGQGVSYESVYKKLIDQKGKEKAIVHFAHHCHNVAAIKQNMDDGTISPRELYFWDPADASWSWSPFVGDLYLYLVN